MVAIYLSKQQALDVDPKAIQHINFTGNLEQQTTTFFIIKERKCFRFFTRNCKSITILFLLLYEILNITL